METIHKLLTDLLLWQQIILVGFGVFVAAYLLLFAWLPWTKWAEHKQRTKPLLWCGLLWLALSIALLVWMRWGTTSEEVQTVAQTVIQESRTIQQEEAPEWLKWFTRKWRLGTTVLALIFGALLSLRVWMGKIFRDERIAKNCEPLPKDWLALVSIVGFTFFTILGLWSFHWTIAPLLWCFWRIGSVPMPKDSEAWVPKWKEQSWRIGAKTTDTEEDTKKLPKVAKKVSEAIKKYGNVFFLADDAPDPKSLGAMTYILLLLFGVPRWLPLYLTVVVNRGPYDEEISFDGYLDKDGIPVSGTVLVAYNLSERLWRFLMQGADERRKSREDSNTLVLNIVPDLVSREGWRELNRESDRLFNSPGVIWDPSEEGRSAFAIVAEQVLEAKGHSIKNVRFGAIKPPKEVYEAEEGIQIAEAKARAEKERAKGIRDVGEAEAAVAEAKAAAPAKGLVEASGNSMTFIEARRSLVEEERAKATRTIIEGNAVPIVQTPPQQP